jgi:Protein of unknown function (DUF1622)
VKAIAVAQIKGGDASGGLSGMREWPEWSSQGIQALALVIIVASIIFGLLRFLGQAKTGVTDSYRVYELLLGFSLLLALELLVAADIMGPVMLDLTAKRLAMLGGLGDPNVS